VVADTFDKLEAGIWQGLRKPTGGLAGTVPAGMDDAAIGTSPGVATKKFWKAWPVTWPGRSLAMMILGVAWLTPGGAVYAAWTSAATWSPLMVSWSSRAVVSLWSASMCRVSSSRARAWALVSRTATSRSISHWVCSE